VSSIDPEAVFRLVLVELPGPELDAETRAFLSARPLGGAVLFRRNLRSAAHAAELCRELHTLVPDPILSIDQEGGSVVRLPELPVAPSAMALGAADDPALTEAVGAAMGRSLRPLGVNLNFAPVADVNVNAENPVIGPRAFGSDPALVARHVRAFVRGQQAAGVAACAKHFPGHGDTRVDSHLALPVLDCSLERLERVELPPFRAALEAGCATVMPGHLLVPALDSRPATVSRVILQDLLRHKLGFEGAVVTDALNMGGILSGFGPRAAAEAIAAGADLVLVLGERALQQESLAELQRAVRDGRIAPERLAEALGRVDALRRRFPSVPQAAAPDPGAEVLVAEAASRALTAWGDPAPVGRDEPLLLVASSSGGQHGPASLAATDREPVTAELYGLLQQAYPGCRLYLYPAADPLRRAAELLDECRRASRVLWLSASPVRPSADERELARRIVRLGASMLHLAVYSPYALLDVPAPALVTYGFRQPSLRALVQALPSPQSCTGRLPIELHPERSA
jgi:beta-N-acetylhexosaminidase